MKKIQFKKQNHPILSMIKNNQNNNKNTLIQLNTTQITLEPHDKVTLNDDYLIIGDEEEPESIVNINQIIIIAKQ